MKRKEAIKKALHSSDAEIFCRGCNAYEAGIRKGMSIADNNPLPSSIGNVVIPDLDDVQLAKFKKDCLNAVDLCNEEIDKRKIY